MKLDGSGLQSLSPADGSYAATFADDGKALCGNVLRDADAAAYFGVRDGRPLQENLGRRAACPITLRLRRSLSNSKPTTVRFCMAI